MTDGSNYQLTQTLKNSGAPPAGMAAKINPSLSFTPFLSGSKCRTGKYISVLPANCLCGFHMNCCYMYLADIVESDRGHKTENNEQYDFAYGALDQQ